MLVYFEARKRIGFPGVLYRVRSWYLLGFILVFREYEQLTASGDCATPSELNPYA